MVMGVWQGTVLRENTATGRTQGERRQSANCLWFSLGWMGEGRAIGTVDPGGRVQGAEKLVTKINSIN